MPKTSETWSSKTRHVNKGIHIISTTIWYFFIWHWYLAFCHWQFVNGCYFQWGVSLCWPFHIETSINWYRRRGCHTKKICGYSVIRASRWSRGETYLWYTRCGLRSILSIHHHRYPLSGPILCQRWWHVWELWWWHLERNQSNTLSTLVGSWEAWTKFSTW